MTNIVFPKSYIIIQKPTPITQANAQGVSTFQETYISWSTRRRGSVQRSHICTNTKNMPFERNQNTPQSGPLRNDPNGLFQPPRNNV